MKFLFFLPLALFAKELPFVILIPSYNNERFCEENLRSALEQDYNNYRILYVNDSSSDRTLEIVESLIADKDLQNRVTLIDNQERLYALGNIYKTIHQEVKDREIVLILDGDDKLSGSYVLSYLNKIYDSEVWLTYGQFALQSSGKKGWCRPFPDRIKQENAFRSYVHLPSHLRTFYGWLFKQIKKEDLLYQGEFFRMTGDSAIMLPMIEMARDHYRFIDKILYLYNDRNPISDHQIDWNLQMTYNKRIRSRPRYAPLERRP